MKVNPGNVFSAPQRGHRAVGEGSGRYLHQERIHNGRGFFGWHSAYNGAKFIADNVSFIPAFSNV